MESRSSEGKVDDIFERKLREVMKNMLDGPGKSGKAKKKTFKDNAELVHAYKDHVSKCRVGTSSSLSSSKKARLELEESKFGVSR